ncbi:hypothetical protein TNCV_629261 [Trichonephila clavipes]|nr:hypothetical protein TNCV_629261 [Trichonephila clavipes]
MDKASSHMIKPTSAYLAKKESERRIKSRLFEEIPVKSPDGSPIDFYTSSSLKRALGKWHQRTLNGVWETAQEEGSKICMTVLRKSLLT